MAMNARTDEMLNGPAAAPGEAFLPSEDAPPTLREVLLKVLWRASVVAVVLSIFIHLFLAVIADMVRFGFGAGEARRSGEVEVAIMTQAELARLEDAALGLDSPEVPDSPLETPDASLQTSIADDGAVSTDLGGVGPVLGGGDISGSSGLGLGGGSGGTSFFGVEARGSRFAFIVDVSGSMGVNNRIDALKRQLVTSVNGLAENGSFFIIAFADTGIPLANRREWVGADERGKRWARQHIQNLEPLGSTQPLGSFELVFRLRPRADAIFFLTDGEFDEQVADDIIILNSEHRIPVHCICLDSRDGERQMKKIALKSGGTYTFVRVGGGGP